MRGRCARPWPWGSWRAFEGVGAHGRRAVPVWSGAGSGALAWADSAGAGSGALASADSAGVGGLRPASAPDAVHAGAGNVLVAGGRVAAGTGPSPAVGGAVRGGGRAWAGAPREHGRAGPASAGSGAGHGSRPCGPADLSSADGGDGSCDPVGLRSAGGGDRTCDPAGLRSVDGGACSSGRGRFAGDAAAHRRLRTDPVGGAGGGIAAVRAPRGTACCLFRRGCRILEVWSLSGTSRASGKRAEGEGAGDECRRTCS